MNTHISQKSQKEVVYDYVEDVDSNLMCAICRSALVDPVTTTSCKHTFCRDCIETAISVKPHCPIDRSALTVNGLKGTEQLVQLMLDELKVRCAVEGCGAVMQRGLLLAHLRSCPKALGFCGEDNCGFQANRQRMSHHRAYECFQRRMHCDKCDLVVKFVERKGHPHNGASEEASKSTVGQPCGSCGARVDSSGTDLHRWSCPSASIPCPHFDRGCTGVFPRSTLPDHLQVCTYEAMSGFFAANDAQIRALEEKQAKADQLIKDLQAELRRVNRGGAFGGGGHGSPQGGHRADAIIPSVLRSSRDTLQSMDTVAVASLPPESTPDAIPGAAGRDQTATRPTHSFTLPPLWRVRTLGASALTSDVPETGHTPTPAYTAERRRPSITARAEADLHTASSSRLSRMWDIGGEGDAARASHVSRAYSFLARTTSPAGRADQGSEIATGEVLANLRMAVLHLANDLDVLERRSEMRTMTENLRLMEQVGSLRAIVDTVRIQVMMNQLPPLRSHGYAESDLPSPAVSVSYSHLEAGPTRTEHSGSGTALPANRLAQSSGAEALGVLPTDTRGRASGSSTDIAENAPSSHRDSTGGGGAAEAVPDTRNAPTGPAEHSSPEDEHETASIQESVVFSAPHPPDSTSSHRSGIVTGGPHPSVTAAAHARALRSLHDQRTRTSRSAAAMIGGLGGTVGQPMGIPPLGPPGGGGDGSRGAGARMGLRDAAEPFVPLGGGWIGVGNTVSYGAGRHTEAGGEGRIERSRSRLGSAIHTGFATIRSRRRSHSHASGP